jgi:hypothetical protein
VENPNVTTPWIRSFLGLSALIAVAVSSPVASAKDEHDSDEFDVQVSKGQVTLVTKGDWHINREYPWKLTVGDTKLDKTKFTLTEKDATVANAPAGTGKLKGAVCSHDACHMVEREVTIP